MVLLALQLAQATPILMQPPINVQIATVAAQLVAVPALALALLVVAAVI